MLDTTEIPFILTTYERDFHRFKVESEKRGCVDFLNMGRHSLFQLAFENPDF